jgi:molybdate transport system substrate-binding protein
VGVALCALALLAGCGSDTGDGARPQLTVSAAASLKTAFEAYGDGFPDARTRFSFAGSDELAGQIRHGAKPDVYAAANTRLPDQLFAEGRVERPRVFAGNRLVIATPAASTGIESIDDLARDRVTLVIGDEDVPVGAYTRTVLGRLPPEKRRAILANVASNEPDVAGLVGKLAQGAADAGFVYASDVKGAAGRMRAVALPAALHPSVRYGAAVVKGTARPEAARAFVDGLLGGRGQAILRRGGFLPPR